MNHHNAKASVIVSIFNAEKYLHQCLDSVVGPTLSDIQIILVNDYTGQMWELLKPLIQYLDKIVSN